MGFNKNVGTKIAAYSAVIGMLYAIFGILEILVGWGDLIGTEASLIPPLEIAGVTVVPPDVNHVRWLPVPLTHAYSGTAGKVTPLLIDLDIQLEPQAIIIWVLGI